MIFDPMYFLFLAPAMLLAVWAQFRVKSAYARASGLGARSGISGAEAAQMIMGAHGVSDVGLEESHGTLSDHYDPKAKMLRLSPEVYHGRSLASLGIAAHEAGHALQDAVGYAPLKFRNGIVPLAGIGSNLSMIIFVVGLGMSSAGMALGQTLVYGAIGLFTVVVLFQLINLKVEFDASARANALLTTSGMVTAEEAPEVRRVLRAAAWTYVATTLTALLTLVYLFVRSQGSRE